jgi:MFS family permease
VSHLFDLVAPPRLGREFRWLLGSVWASNFADGVLVAAGPLLVASQTHSAFLVALAALVQWLPPLLFALIAGALTDRLDRRVIVFAVNLVQAAVLALIAVSIVTHTVSIGVLLCALFLIGTAETFADNASLTTLPLLAHRDDLVIGNARLQTGFITLRELAGPPLGAALFAAGMAWPFAASAVLVAAAGVLFSRIALPAHPVERDAARRMRHEVAEGFRWTWHHAAVRTLVLTIFTFNITFGAAWSVLVLYATRHLHLGAIGFGLVTTVLALGGLAGTLLYGQITRHVSLGNLMRIGLIIETLTHLALALTTVAWVALAIFFVFGAHAFVWGTTSITVRQRAVPNHLQGRVNSVNTVGVFGGLVIGSGIGGLLAQHFGVTAPFWFAFAGSAIFVVLIWRQLAHIAHSDDAAVPALAIGPN